MDALLREVSVLGLKDRKVSLVGNHTWASSALKVMQEIVGAMTNFEIIGTPMDVRSTLKAEREGEIDALVDAIYASVNE
jgi:flavorubredoxin